jgi:hypothetical protein
MFLVGTCWPQIWHFDAVSTFRVVSRTSLLTLKSVGLSQFWRVLVLQRAAIIFVNGMHMLVSHIHFNLLIRLLYDLIMLVIITIEFHSQSTIFWQSYGPLCSCRLKANGRAMATQLEIILLSSNWVVIAIAFPFAGKDLFRKLGFSVNEFDMLTWLTSWAVNQGVEHDSNEKKSMNEMGIR